MIKLNTMASHLKGVKKSISKLLSHEQIIKNIMGNNTEDNVEDDNHVLEYALHKNALKATITLHNFLLQYENSIFELLNALGKVTDEIQGDMNFKKKQVPLESYFTKVS